MKGVYKHGWDCTEVRETGFLQDLANDDKRRIPEKTLASRTRRDGQDIAKMPEHTKEQGAATTRPHRKGKHNIPLLYGSRHTDEETWASWKKKVLGGPSGAFVEEVMEKDVTVVPTTVFGVKQQFEMDEADLRFKHRKIPIFL